MTIVILDTSIVQFYFTYCLHPSVSTQHNEHSAKQC